MTLDAQADTLLHVTLYRGQFDPVPIDRTACTWPELVEALRDKCTTDAAPSKDVALFWAPHRLREGTTRALANVVSVSVLVIDVDGADMLAVCDEIETAKLDAVLYTSPSDEPDVMADDERRFRVVTPLRGPITGTPEQINRVCWRTRYALAEMLGLRPGQGVEGAKDAARGFFVGYIEGTSPREFLEWHAGELV